jgi:hypothetical protein
LYATNFIRSLPKEAKDPVLMEKLFHYGEDPTGVQLDPREKAIFDKGCITAVLAKHNRMTMNLMIQTKIAGSTCRMVK